MNDYINQQITTLEQYLNHFIMGCELAATKDGIKSNEEEKKLKRIKKITEKYKSELNKLK